MRKSSLPALALGVLALAAPASAARAQQSPTPEQTFTRPRTVGGAPASRQPQEPSKAEGQNNSAPRQQTGPAQPATTPPSAPAVGVPPRQTTRPAAVNTAPAPSATPVVVPSIGPALQLLPPLTLQPARPLSLSKARRSQQEAERLLRSRSTATASTPNISWVTIAALDQDSSQIHLLALPKDTLLTRGAEVQITSNAGMPLRLRIHRPNYVNTQVVVSDLAGRQLTPLVIEYPIEKFGRFREMAYYTSAHPSLLTPELVKNGQNYVRTMLDLATRRLKEKSKIIAPEIVDIAERLAIVEHVDHQRFRTESRADLYNEVYALFALNELNTYRYSVSSAGAGGMVQMIPSTYQMIRRLHPSVGLNPDFVAGMRNHGNALEAMLLHMQDNWNQLALNEDVLEAMRQNWATQTELVAAGYNSNSARLPGYIRRGGANWRYLIPRETQMYHQIYKSFEGLVPLKSRAEKGENAEAPKN